MIDKKQIITDIINHANEVKRNREQFLGFQHHETTKNTLQKIINENLEKISEKLDSWIDERIDNYLKGKSVKKKGKKSIPDIM
jgi:hypothetical protein